MTQPGHTLEWALKLKELAYVRTHAYSTADFEHGLSTEAPRGLHKVTLTR